MQDSSGAETAYTYTENDLLESIFRGDGRGIRYSYDLNDRLQSIEDHEGDTTAYSFNERNEVTSVTHDGRTVAYGYDLVGRRTSTGWGLLNALSSPGFDITLRIKDLNGATVNGIKVPNDTLALNEWSLANFDRTAQAGGALRCRAYS